MCNISEGVVEKTWHKGIEIGRNEGRREGIEIGEKRGEKRGERRGVLNSILNLMKNAPLTFDQATALLGIPENEREEYRTLIDEQLG